jgi:hypothetical protein
VPHPAVRVQVTRIRRRGSRTGSLCVPLAAPTAVRDMTANSAARTHSCRRSPPDRRPTGRFRGRRWCTGARCGSSSRRIAGSWRPDQPLSPVERARVKELEAEVAQLRMENEFLKSSGALNRSATFPGTTSAPIRRTGGVGLQPGGYPAWCRALRVFPAPAVVVLAYNRSAIFSHPASPRARLSLLANIIHKNFRTLRNQYHNWWLSPVRQGLICG